MDIIYGLSSDIDPENIRYIGKTKNIKDRLRRHLSVYGLRVDTYKNRWIKSELLKGNKILITLLYEVGDGEDWKDIEVDWISRYRRNGYQLVNSTDGGDGSMSVDSIDKRNKTRIEKNLKDKSEEIKKYNVCEVGGVWFGSRVCICCEKTIIHKSKGLNKIIYLIRKLKDKKCLRCKSFDRKLTQEEKDKISLSKKTLSDDTRKKLSLIHKGKKVSEETRKKIANTLTGKKHSEETRKKMSDARKGKKYKKSIGGDSANG